MKRLTATILVLSAISAPVLAETPTDRSMHSWDYVNQVATQALTPPEAPAMEHHEQRPYYHHDAGKHHGMKHHHEGTKHHHDGAKHHHHKGHHHKDETKKDAQPVEQPKQ